MDRDTEPVFLAQLSDTCLGRASFELPAIADEDAKVDYAQLAVLAAVRIAEEYHRLLEGGEKETSGKEETAEEAETRQRNRERRKGRE